MKPTRSDHLDDAALAEMGLSRDTEITLTTDGRFLNAGVPFAHEGLARAFAGWIDRGPDGRWVLRNDIHWVRLVVEGAPLHARGVELGPDGATLLLTSGEREPLRPETVVEGPDGALYARARDGTWPVRLQASAVLDLAGCLEDGPAPGERPTLRIGGRSWPIVAVADPLLVEALAPGAPAPGAPAPGAPAPEERQE